MQAVQSSGQGMRAAEAEQRANPVRGHLRPAKLINVVRDILERDVGVEVPHSSLETDGKVSLGDLLKQWDEERQKTGQIGSFSA
jgi:hypothetical protein